MPISQVFLSNTFNEFRQTTNLVIDEINALTNGTGVLVVDGTTPLTGTFTIDGNLVVTGETTTVVSSTLSVQDNMIYLNYADGPFTITNVTDTGTAVTYTIDSEIENTDFQVGWTAVITGVNPSAYNISGLIDSIDTGANSFTILSTATGTYVNGGTVTAKASANVDLGWAGGYQTSPTDINTYAHAGIFRDATDGVFKIYEGYTLEPDAQVNIDTTHSSFSYASVAGKTFTSNNVITDDVVTDGNFVIGKLYNITVEGNTVWTEVGATTGSLGEQFVATATGSNSPGTGTAREAEYETTAITISSDFGDLVAQRTYIDFVFTDDNSNETPQVRIGAQVGDNDKNADGIIEEGHGAFVIYTNNADTGAGAAGASLVERMRVDHLGNVGIGTNNPATALDVVGTVTADGLTVDDAGTIQLTKNTVAAGDSLGVLEFHDEDGVATGDAGKFQIKGVRGADKDAPDLQFIGSNSGGTLIKRLDVNGSGDISFYEDTGTDASLVYTAASTSLKLTGREVSRSNSTYALEVDNSAQSSNMSTAGAFNVKGYYGNQLTVNGLGDISFYDDSGTAKFFWDASTERLGIGTASPSSDLHIASSLATIRLEDSDVAGGTAYSLITGSSAGNLAFSADPDNVRSSSDIRFNIDGTERLRINSSGDVTINSSGTIPTGVLLGRQLVVGSATGSEIIAFREDTDVNVGDISGALLIGNSDIDGVEDHFVGMWGKVSSTNGSQDLHFAAGRSGYEGDIPQMTLDASGNLLVGTTDASPVTSNVDGIVLKNNGQVQFSYTGTGVAMNRKGTDGNIIDFRKDGATFGSVGTSSSSLYIGKPSGSGLMFQGGNTIPVTGSSAADATYDLGASGVRFKDLYLSGGLRGDTTFSNNAGTTEYARFDSSGNLMVGQTTGTIYNQSSVTGVTAAGSGSVQATTSAGTTLFLNRLSSDGQIIGFYKDGAQVGAIGSKQNDTGTGNSYIYIAGGNTGLFFDDVNNYIRPANASGALRNNIVDLGEPDSRFKDLHLSGTTYSSGLNIESTGNTTVNAITLDWEHLSTDVDIEQRIQWRFGDDATADGFSEAAYIGAGKEAPWNVNSNRDSYLAFGTTLDNVSDERMRITSDGKVGIGVDDPQYRLHVISSGDNSSVLETTGTAARAGTIKIENQNTTLNAYAALELRADTADAKIAVINRSTTVTNTADLAFIVDDASENFGSEKMRIVGDTGKVGIGTDSPTYKLEIDAPADGTDGILVTNANANAAARAAIALRTDGAALDMYSTSATYNGVSGWADSGVISTSTGTSGGLKLNAQTSGIYFQTNAGGAGVRNSGTKWSIDIAGDFLASGYGDVIGSETLTTFFRRTDYNHGRIYAEEMVLSHAPEQDHVTHPYLMNDLANFVQRGGTFTKHGVDNVSAGEIRNVFRPNAKNMSSIASDYIVGISNATFNTTYIEYTTNENHNLYAGEKVTVSGTLDNLSGSTFDVTDATVLADSLSANTFRVAASGITTTWASAGTATTQRYVITLSDLPVGLTYGGHYGISFGTKDSFHPEEVKVEVSNNNESSYTTVVDYFNVVGSIASATFASDYIEYTTVAAHGLVAGQSVLVDGTVDSSSGSSYDKTATVAVRSDGLTATAFRVSSSDPGTTHTANTGVVRAGDQERTLTSYVGYFSAGASAPTHIRYTIGRPKNSSTRLTNLYAYNYNSNGMEDYFISEGGEIGGNGIIETGNGATASVNTTTIFTYDAASTSGADIVVTATDTVTNERHIMKMLITHDANNTAATATQYGSVFTNGELADFDVSISGADVIVTATAYSTNSTTYKIMGHLLTN